MYVYTYTVHIHASQSNPKFARFTEAFPHRINPPYIYKCVMYF